jgi:hypothetical protein
MAKKHTDESIVIGGKPNRSLHLDLSAKKILSVLGGVLVLIALLYVVPFTKPFVNRFIGIATPQSSGPCSGDSKLLDTYNSTVLNKGVSELPDIAKQVRANKQYKSDPSCVYISMVAYYGADLTTEALTEYNQLKQLKAEGKKPSSKIADGIDLKILHEGIKPQKSGGNDGRG